MKYGIFVCVAALIFVLAACSQKTGSVNCTPNSDLNALRSLKLQNAENDARRDNGKGDHRLQGINAGVGLIVPDLATNPDTSGYGLRIVDGTDVSCSPEEHQLNIEAMHYAKKYNHQKMLLWQPRTN